MLSSGIFVLREHDRDRNIRINLIIRIMQLLCMTLTTLLFFVTERAFACGLKHRCTKANGNCLHQHHRLRLDEH